jgi:hypothetical protein
MTNTKPLDNIDEKALSAPVAEAQLPAPQTKADVPAGTEKPVAIAEARKDIAKAVNPPKAGTEVSKPASEKKSEAAKPAPLSVTLSDGKTFAEPNDFTAHIRKLRKENPAQADADQADYDKRFQEKLNSTKAQIATAIKLVPVAIKLSKNPKNPKSRPGVHDLLKPFVDQGVVTLDANGKYETGLEFALALASKANERVSDLILGHQIENGKIVDGFTMKDKEENIRFHFRIENSTDPATHHKKIKITKVIGVRENQKDLEGTEYILGISLTPGFLKLASEQLTKRLAERQKQADDRKAKTTQAKAESSTSKTRTSTEKPKAPAAKPAEVQRPNPLVEKEQAFSKLIKENLEKNPQLKLINSLMHASRTQSPAAATPSLSLKDIDRLLIASFNWSDKTPPQGLRDLAKKGIEPNLDFLLKVANTLQEEIRKSVPAEDKNKAESTEVKAA